MREMTKAFRLRSSATGQTSASRNVEWGFSELFVGKVKRAPALTAPDELGLSSLDSST